MGIFGNISSSILSGNSVSQRPEDRQTSSQDDEKKLIDKFENFWNESESLQEMQLKWIEKNRKLYLGEHFNKKNRPKSRSNTIHNKIFENVDAYESKLTEKLPEAVVAVNSDDQYVLDGARTVGHALAHLGRVDNMQMKAESIVHNMLIDRDACVVLRWDPFKGKDGDITVEVAKAEHYRVDPNSTPFDQGEYFFNAPPRNYRYVLERFPEHREHILESFGLSEKDVSDHKKKDVLLPLKEIWYWQDDGDDGFNVYQCIYLKDKILFTQKNPYWDFEGELSPEDEDDFNSKMQDVEEVALVRGHELAESRKKEIEEEYKKRRRYRNFLEKQMFPYVLFPTFIDDDSPYSRTSFVEQVASLQFSLNESKQTIDENGKLMAKGIWIKDTNSGVSNNQITSAAGAIITKNPGTEIRREQGTALPSEYFNNMSDSEQAIDNVFGSNDISKGQRIPGATAREAILLKEADEGRVAKVARKFEKGMEMVYAWQVHLMKLFYTEPRLVTIANAMGVVDSFSQMSGDDIPDDLQIFVQMGSSRDQSERAKREEAVIMFEKGQIDSITFFERHGGFKDPKKQAEMLWQYQNGTLFNQPDVGPEQRARQAIDAALAGENVELDESATFESVAILAEAIKDTSLPWTDEAIQKIEEKAMNETKMINGRNTKQRAERRLERMPADLAQEFPDTEIGAQKMEQMAEQEQVM